MTHSLTAGVVMDGASGLVLVGVAALVLLVRPQGRANVAFAAFSGAHGVAIAVSNFLSWHWKDVLWLSAGGYVVASAGLVTFVLSWPRRATRRDAPLVGAAAALALAWAVLYAGAERFGWRSYHFAWYPELGRSAVTMAENYGYTLILAAYWMAFAIMTLQFARDSASAAPTQRQFALVAVALAAFPCAYVGSQSLAFGTGDMYAGLVGVAGAVALAGVWLRSAAASPYSRAATGVALGALGAALLGMGAAALAGGHLASSYTGIFGVVRTVTALVLAYAIVRHQLLGIDLRVKRTLREGTAVAALVGAYIVVSITAELFLEGRSARLLGIGATAALLAAIVPLRRLGARVADAVMPNVSDSAAYVDARKVEVYRAALLEAVEPDGALPPRRTAFLARLREELGLTQRDHDVLLHALAAPRARDGPREGAVLAGRYHVRARLGNGSQGATFLADDAVLGRPVAVKCVTAAGDGVRLLREARAAGAVRHEGVVTVHDVVEHGSDVLVVMEHVDGGSLKDRLAHGRLARAEFGRVAADLLYALAAVHAAGLVHGDVKPSNVLLTSEGRAKLADFGVSRAMGADETATFGAASPVGTLRYMAPEQAGGGAATPSSDVYAAAATLYEAWTGRSYVAPRPGESAIELQLRVASLGEFDGDFEGPDALRAWFRRALAPAPAARFGSARAAGDALARALAPNAMVDD